MEFHESLILIVVPILVGAISTHFLSHSWQDYKYKILLKQELFDLFNEAINKQYKLNISLVDNITRHYSSTEKIESVLKEGYSVMEFEEFPSEPEKLPLNIFSDEYKKMVEESRKARSFGDLFVSKLRLYSEDDTILDSFKKINNHILYSRISIKQLIESKDESEFVKKCNDFFEQTVIGEKLIKKFQESLVQIKIRKIPV